MGQTIVGFDAGKKKSIVNWIDPASKREQSVRVDTTREALKGLVAKVPEGARFIVEASTTGKAVARFLRESGADAVLVPADVLSAALRRLKNDKIDARDLRVIGETGAYTPCYVPTPEEESLRSLGRAIDSKGKQISRLKNQVQAIAQRHLVPAPDGNMENAHVAARWRRIPVPPYEVPALEAHLEDIKRLREGHADLKLQLYRVAHQNPNVHLLLTIHQVDVYTAACVVAECGDVSRFSTSKKLVSYAGLAPRVFQSGDRYATGRISKRGPSLLRHVLIQAAHRIIKEKGKLRNQYARLLPRTGKKKAIVAIARKLLVAIWHMLTRGQPFQGYNPERAAARQWRLRHVATLLEQGHRDNAIRLMNTQDLARIHANWKAGTSRIANPPTSTAQR